MRALQHVAENIYFDPKISKVNCFCVISFNALSSALCFLYLAFSSSSLSYFSAMEDIGTEIIL